MIEVSERSLSLSAQWALLGAVGQNLRAVTIGWEPGEVKIRYIFDGPISEEDDDEIRCVGTEIAADLPDGWTVEDEIVQHDYPNPLQPLMLKRWVYMRKEK